MRWSIRRRALLGALTLLTAGCARGPFGWTAGDPKPGEGGIGGTGALAGDVGGTGVFGTITGFGSIRVGGVRVEVPDGLAVDALPVGLTADRLTIGDAVAIEAVVERGALIARRVVRLVPLLGPVERLDMAGRGLRVMGTLVLLDDATAWPESVRIGDWVRVSGLWRGGAVAASRIDRLPEPATATATGLLRREGWRWFIGGTRIELDATTDRAEPGFAAVSGALRDGRFVAQRVASGSRTLFPQAVKRLVIEAYLARDPGGGGYHLAGFGIPMDPASTAPSTVGRRAIFVGRYDGDAFLIERSLPSDPVSGQMPAPSGGAR